MSKMKKIAAMTAALLICASTMGYLPQDSIIISNVTANAAEEEITSVEINEANFPDVNFRDYIKSSFDTDYDGVLSAEEIAAVTEIILSEDGMHGITTVVSDLKGIEYFTNLEELNCNDSNLTEIDLSKNTKLKYLECDGNALASLDVSKNTALISLSCSENKLTSIDVSQNAELVALFCLGNQFTNLDISSNAELEHLNCSYNNLTNIDVSNNAKLMRLNCSENQITALDVTNNPEIDVLICSYNQLSEIDISNNKKLALFECSGNNLTSLDLCSPILSECDFSKNTYKITLTDNTFDLSALPTGFDISKASDWTNATVEGNILTVEDITKEATYKYDCGYDTYETFTLIPASSADTSNSVAIDATNFPDAKFRKYVADNCDTDGDRLLSAEEIASVTEIILFTFMDSGVSDLSGIEYFTSLTNLYCEANSLTSLDLSKNTALTKLYCGCNELTSLDLSNNTALENLWCYENQLTSLDLSNNTALTELDCSDNNLTSLDVSNNSALTTLYCSYNQLTSLDISNNTALFDLSCHNNQLTSLDVSNNTALKRLTTDENEYEITLTGKTFDLSTLPTGFDVTSASDWTNGTVKGNILTVEDASKNIIYKYDLGNGNSETFTLIPQIEETPVETTTAPKTTTTTITTTATTTTTAMFTTTTFAPPSYSCSLNVYPYDEADTIYEIGEELDYSTICVHGYGTMTSFGSTTYMDIPYISLDRCNLTVDASEFDNTKPGTYTIYVEWYNAKDSFEVTVIDPDNPTAIPGVEINETNFPDPVFRQYLAKNFDKNTDGRLSDKEIADVTGLYLGELGISDLTGIQHFENLKTLGCSDNDLTQLDISENKALTHLYCENNNLTTLDTSNNVLLFVLDCHNNKLTKLDFSNNPELKAVWCCDNQLTSLDVSHNTLLSDLACSNNQLASIDLSNTICIEIAEWGLLLYGNKHKITITDNTFDLSTLPTNFDVTKASDWTNATVKGNILTIEDITKEVTYTYDCGLGFSDTFALVPQIEETPAETTTVTTTTTTAAPETTTTATTTTPAANETPEEDLPQTGFSKLYNCIPVSAGALVLLGMYAVKKSKKEDEE